MCCSRSVRRTGHLHALVPLAHATRDAGHDVALAMPGSFQGTVERLGLQWFAAGLDESFPEYVRFIEERDRLPGRERAMFNRRGAVTLLGRRTAVDTLRIL